MHDSVPERMNLSCYSVQILCGLVAAAIHYSFMAVFCSMLAQGVYILLQLGYKMAQKIRMKKWHYVLLIWGKNIPLTL